MAKEVHVEGVARRLSDRGDLFAEAIRRKHGGRERPQAACAAYGDYKLGPLRACHGRLNEGDRRGEETHQHLSCQLSKQGEW
jgi:hypothetical protein